MQLLLEITLVSVLAVAGVAGNLVRARRISPARRNWHWLAVSGVAVVSLFFLLEGESKAHINVQPNYFLAGVYVVGLVVFLRILRRRGYRLMSHEWSRRLAVGAGLAAFVLGLYSLLR